MRDFMYLQLIKEKLALATTLVLFTEICMLDFTMGHFGNTTVRVDKL